MPRSAKVPRSILSSAYYHYHHVLHMGDLCVLWLLLSEQSTIN